MWAGSGGVILQPDSGVVIGDAASAPTITTRHQEPTLAVIATNVYVGKQDLSTTLVDVSWETSTRVVCIHSLKKGGSHRRWQNWYSCGVALLSDSQALHALMPQ